MCYACLPTNCQAVIQSSANGDRGRSITPRSCTANANASDEAFSPSETTHWHLLSALGELCSLQQVRHVARSMKVKPHLGLLRCSRGLFDNSRTIAISRSSHTVSACFFHSETQTTRRRGDKRSQQALIITRCGPLTLRCHWKSRREGREQSPRLPGRYCETCPRSNSIPARSIATQSAQIDIRDLSTRGRLWQPTLFGTASCAWRRHLRYCF